MDNVQRLTQAYSQAPWRKQLQLIGLFSLVVILGALVAGIYLNVTARAATTGRSIQDMRRSIERLKRSNADLQTQLALITSNAEMEKRALELGFSPIDPNQIQYLIVPGYHSRQPVISAPLASPALSSAPMASAEYGQSLFEWIRERVFEPAAPLVEIKQ
jgi:cell division protein FtsL